MTMQRTHQTHTRSAQSCTASFSARASFVIATLADTALAVSLFVILSLVKELALAALLLAVLALLAVRIIANVITLLKHPEYGNRKTHILYHSGS